MTREWTKTKELATYHYCEMVSLQTRVRDSRQEARRKKKKGKEEHEQKKRLS